MEKTSRLTGLPPVVAADARLLVLGSMPGSRSLEDQQYYAHPRNAFWPIMGELAGAGPALAYERRLEGLKAAGIALWDVVGQCRRPGSLDSRIEPDSVRANDIGGLLAGCPSLVCIAFNGQAAARLFKQHVVPALGKRYATIERVGLPSTSPAHAAMSVARKTQLWSDALDGRVRSDRAAAR